MRDTWKSGPTLRSLVRASQAGLLSLALLPFRALPESCALRLGGFTGSMVPRLFPRYARRARENLVAAYPERGAAWVEEVIHESFRHFGRMAVEVLRAPKSVADDRWDSLIDVRGGDHLLSARPGAIAVGGHLGNWEIAPAWVARQGRSVLSAVDEPRNERLAAMLRAVRRRLGNTTVHKQGCYRPLARHVRGGGVAAVLIDRNPRSSGVLVPFFEREALAVSSPALLSLQTGAPLVPFACLRTGPAFRYRLTFAPPIAPDLSRPRDDEVGRLTHLATQALEAFVREAPGQWQWMHRRWKLSDRGLLRAGAARGDTTRFLRAAAGELKPAGGEATV
jgi:KDO2-lipid IV(A) lauroyltransferase